MYVDGVSILAHGIAAYGPDGLAFEGVDLRVEPGALSVIAGAEGTGRTALLLALSGRLRTVAGYLDVSGLVLPDQAGKVRKLIRPARLRPGCELDRHHLVGEAITERRLISGVSKGAIETAFDLVGVCPDRKARVGELSPGLRLLLAIALTMAAAPAGILVDDVEAGLPVPQQARVWTALHDITRLGTTVLATATDPPAGEIDVIALPPQHRQRHTEVLDLRQASLP